MQVNDFYNFKPICYILRMKKIPMPARRKDHSQKARITHIKPWPRHVIEKACKGMAAEWDKIEDAGIRSQGKPDFND